MRKIMFLLASATASKHAIAAPVGAGLIAAYFSQSLGFDPWPWILGALGGGIIRVKLPPTSRLDSIANGVISVMLAGFGSPSIISWFKYYLQSVPPPNIYLVAFVVAVVWPWLIKFGWETCKTWFTKRSEQ